MEHFYVITSIQPKYKYLSGPALVAVELSKELTKKGYNCTFFDTYRSSKIKSLLAYSNIFLKILFTKRATIYIHSQGYVTSLIFCLNQLIRPSHKLIYTMHGLPLKENTYRDKNKKIPQGVYIQETAFKTLLNLANNVICVSNTQAQHIKDNYTVKANVSVIYNGITPKKITLSNQPYCSTKKRAVMAGGISNRKSIIETIQAFLLYNAKNTTQWTLDIYGEISDSYRVPLVTELCAQSKGLISYHGMLDQDSLHQEMSKSDLYIAMSQWDTFNLAALQAMSFGIPCISSKQSGISELISHNNNGFIVDAESPELIEDCIEILRNIESLGEEYKKLQKAAHDIACNNSWTYVASNYLRLAARN